MNPAGDINWLKTVLAFALVLALLALFGFILKYLGERGFALPGKAVKARRLRLVEQMALDARRRLVIVACDGREHLLLLSGNEDIVVQANLPPAPPEKTP